MLIEVVWRIARALGLEDRLIGRLGPERRAAMIDRALDALSREWGVELE